ncbi:MAG: hypothetical protein AAGA20_19230, partial [Planctomycetota bacterium]
DGAIFMAGEDTFGTLALVREQMPDLVARFHAEEVPGVDHFFTGKLDDLRLRVRDWAATQLGSPEAAR